MTEWLPAPGMSQTIPTLPLHDAFNLVRVQLQKGHMSRNTDSSYLRHEGEYLLNAELPPGHLFAEYSCFSICWCWNNSSPMNMSMNCIFWGNPSVDEERVGWPLLVLPDLNYCTELKKKKSSSSSHSPGDAPSKV